SLSIRR
ncbi:hypothetical protein TrRE_jg9305, partial [Triparma retinervis]